MKLFNHIQIKVQDLSNSKKFYDPIMKIMGYKIVLEIADVVIGYGTDVNDMFEIRQACPDALQSQNVHIAFNAHSKICVDDFYKVAIQNGAICNGRPGHRPQYEDGYYAAFIIDINGHNIEAVYNALMY